ncbi:hypothetical protein AAFC00_006505 [Neodothiora populina]|uniref:Aminotransferase class V domain-containing protein n=1 Tax=Neodothiora populina TaxID=2781224 RepID=A0ABR3PA86_9PEZI
MSTQTTSITSKISLASSAYDVENYRSLVPVVAETDILYLNASYQPPMNIRVRRAIDGYLDEALHEPHPKPMWQASGEETRALVGRYIGAPPESIAFTSDTTEGLNLFQRSLNLGKGDNVVVLDTEHPNHAYGWLALQETGLEVRQVPTNDRLYADASTFAPFVDENTKAIGISSIMFHSGQKNNVKDICDHFRPRGIHVLADITQEVGVGPINVTRTGVSAACFSFHKALGCPTGLGALYINPVVLEQIKQTPPIVGAGAISNLRADLLAMSGPLKCHKTTKRYEHLNLSLISLCAANAALRLLLDEMTPEGVEAHLRSLGRVLQDECKALGIQIIGEEDEAKRAPHLYVLKLLDLAWAEHFSRNSTYVSCYRLGVRVSLGFYNTEADIRKLGVVLRKGLEMGLPAC